MVGSVSLYLDTSDHLVLGLLDEDFQWIDFAQVEGAKNSSRIHSAIYTLLEKIHLKPLHLKRIFQNAGPGSYTGMRVSEGISQIFEWQGIPIFSFYHFEVPKLLGVEQGQWLAKAFKGEFFLASWNVEGSKTELLTKEAVQFFLEKEACYCHFQQSLEKDFGVLSHSLKETSQLIKEQGSDLFPLIFKRKTRFGPCYFRSLDQEFKISR